MFKTIISTLQLQGEDEHHASKRKFERRATDHCVSVINDKTYPVENWSSGGVLIFADSKPFALNAEVEVKIKFKLRDEIVDVPHKAKVIRKTYNHVALEFLPLTQKIKKIFQSVIDDQVAAQFVDSQLV